MQNKPLQMGPLFRGLLILSLLFSLLVSGCASPSSPESSVPETAVPGTESLPAEKEDLETILVMGLDKYEFDARELGYLNDQQADFLLVLVLDRKAERLQVLQLDRDTMTEIRRLGVGGGNAGRFTGQLALAHTYGSGGSDSCLNTCKAVSTLLGGIHIDHYIALNMESVGLINDLVGGVTVEIMDDFTDIDPTMVKGELVTLRGDQALRYVRTRAGLEDSSNRHRMIRQRQYLTAFYEQLKKAREEDEDFLADSLLDLSTAFQSDCTVNQLDALGETILDMELDPFLSVQGEAVKGEEFMEFYPDEDSLQQIIRELFYE